jgi:hypothetical protein
MQQSLRQRRRGRRLPRRPLADVAAAAAAAAAPRHPNLEAPASLPPAVDGIGVLSQSHVLWSLDLAADSPTSIRFVVDAHAPSLRHELVWIDSQGYERHKREQPPASEGDAEVQAAACWSHVEHTHAGHAFALFQAASPGAPRKLLLAYRATAALGPSQRHLVSVTGLGCRACVEPVCEEARVMVGLVDALRAPATGDWSVSYTFVVPPLPHAAAASPSHTVYVWGDVSFSREDARGRQVHAFKMNQVVPQVMCGRCLCGSDPRTFEPEFRQLRQWTAQAQHYWQTPLGELRGSRALCGALVPVDPGEVLESGVAFVAGEMRAWIQVRGQGARRRSEIRSSRVFPSHPRVLPAGWPQLFRELACGVDEFFGARPTLNIEYKADAVDPAVLDSLCPLRVLRVALPDRAPLAGEKLGRAVAVSTMNAEMRPSRVRFD